MLRHSLRDCAVVKLACGDHSPHQCSQNVPHSHTDSILPHMTGENALE